MFSILKLNEIETNIGNYSHSILSSTKYHLATTNANVTDNPNSLHKKQLSKFVPDNVKPLGTRQWHATYKICNHESNCRDTGHLRQLFIQWVTARRPHGHTAATYTGGLWRRLVVTCITSIPRSLKGNNNKTCHFPPRSHFNVIGFTFPQNMVSNW